MDASDLDAQSTSDTESKFQTVELSESSPVKTDLTEMNHVSVMSGFVSDSADQTTLKQVYPSKHEKNVNDLL